MFIYCRQQEHTNTLCVYRNGRTTFVVDIHCTLHALHPSKSFSIFRPQRRLRSSFRFIDFHSSLFTFISYQRSLSRICWQFQGTGNILRGSSHPKFLSTIDGLNVLYSNLITTNFNSFPTLFVCFAVGSSSCEHDKFVDVITGSICDGEASTFSPIASASFFAHIFGICIMDYGDLCQRSDSSSRKWSIFGVAG